MNPKEFYTDLKNVRAIVLGADPSTKGKVQFEYVFGINSHDSRYFAPIEKNLTNIGLSIDNIYVQNLIPEYLEFVTTENDEWEVIAEKWVPKLRNELDKLNPAGNIPVLVTAERVFKFLNNHSTPEAKDIYSQKADLFKLTNNNKLNRTIIPFYRNYYYSLEKNDWKGYKKVLIDWFK